VNEHFQSVDLSKAYRLVNHGPTVLISARHDGVENVMTAAWCCGLDFNPPKLSVVLDNISHTRSLIERSGRFVVQLPTVEQIALTQALGTRSMYDSPDKLISTGVKFVRDAGHSLPLVEGCSAWLECRLIPEPHIQDAYDLFLGEVLATWADDRVFRDGRWHFETADPKWRTLHHVAGGHYYAIGDAMDAS
jgi:flavin reductase (DIM6/NTAB) family NADH-FMN oxidoreductase RutF